MRARLALVEPRMRRATSGGASAQWPLVSCAQLFLDKLISVVQLVGRADHIFSSRNAETRRQF